MINTAEGKKGEKTKQQIDVNLYINESPEADGSPRNISNVLENK